MGVFLQKLPLPKSVFTIFYFMLKKFHQHNILKIKGCHCWQPCIKIEYVF